MERLHSVTSPRRRMVASRPTSVWRSPLLLALGTALVHVLVAAVAVLILLRPAPRWFVLYEITGTPLPLPSRLAWDLSLGLRHLLPLVVLAAPVAFVADALLAHRLFQRSPRYAGRPWFWGVLVLLIVATALWFAAALVLPRRNL